MIKLSINKMLNNKYDWIILNPEAHPELPLYCSETIFRSKESAQTNFEQTLIDSGFKHLEYKVIDTFFGMEIK